MCKILKNNNKKLTKKELLILQEKAYRIAKIAHAGQTDKAGKDYFTGHILFVTNMVKTTEEKIVALLHDVVEDTSISLKFLINENFPAYLIKSIDAITKRKNESYDEYIKRVALDEIATEVKKADLTHNSDLSRLNIITQKDLARVQKYRYYLLYLNNL